MGAAAILTVSVALWVAGPAGVASSASDEEPIFALLITQERASRNLAPLSPDEELLVVARSHAQRMAEARSVFHNPNLPSEISGWQVLGENVGRGSTVEAIHDAFMSSPTHRAEILDASYRGFAVGTVVSGGQIWVTQLFVLRQQPVVAAERHGPPPKQQLAIPVPLPVSRASRPPGVEVPESLQFRLEKSASLRASALALLLICIDGFLFRVTKRRLA